MIRQEIINQCNQIIDKGICIENTSHMNPIIKCMIPIILKRIKKIKEICSVDKYNLYFIGETGVGKSSAISNLTGLINKIEKNKSLNSIPLLKTNRTAICDITIKYTNNKHTTIQIESIPYEEFEILVDKYFLHIIDKKIENTNIKLPQEVRHIICNMADFPEDNKEQQIRFIRRNLRIIRINDEEFLKNLKPAILKSCNYENRNKKIFEYTENDNLFDWIKEMLIKINNGTDKNIPYPKKIEILLGSDIDYNINSNIKTITNIKGLDDLEISQENIVDICKNINNICIICDKILNYGSIIYNSFLADLFDLKNIDLKYRNFILGLEKGIELSEINEDNKFNNESREKGKSIVKKETYNNFKNKICLDEENMLFYNCFYGIDYNNKKIITGFSYQDYENEKTSLLETIDKKILYMYDEYYKELKEIDLMLNKLYENQLESSDIECLKKVTKFIVSLLNKPISNHKPIKELEFYTHRNSNFSNYNIYFQLENIVGKNFDDSINYFYIKEKISEIFEEKQDEESYINNIIKKLVLEKIDDLYNIYRNNITKEYRSIIEQSLYNYGYPFAVEQINTPKYIFDFFKELYDFFNFESIKL